MPEKRPHIIIIVAFTVALSAPLSHLFGQVVEQRTGTANPMETIGKSTLYGMGTGILLGTAYSLASNNTKFVDGVKWGFIAGTGGGFIVGAVYVLTRPSPRESALLEFGKSKNIRIAWPAHRVYLSRGSITGATINLLHIDF